MAMRFTCKKKMRLYIVNKNCVTTQFLLYKTNKGGKSYVKIISKSSRKIC